jgi:hypothetical protein
MIYKGKVENGVVVLVDAARLPEGLEVRVEPVSETTESQQSGPSDEQTLRDGLLSFSGMVKGGPTDLARNHDHYLHGTPKK